MLNFIEVKNPRLLKIVSELANKIWNEYYKPMLGDFQVRYMLESIHNIESINKEINDGYKYFLLQKNDQNIGYLSFVKRSETKCTNNRICDIKEMGENDIFLHKLYILKQFRGLGIGKAVLEYIIKHSKDSAQIWLMVNKHNKSAIDAYERLGFYRKDNMQIDIGKGYIINEVVMARELQQYQVS
ncbi:GNAT family N-acetyltransferase [Helicobacter sp. 16-1353]|uniref:GNAT family N-acetyltransferase n=1 Tax=Helicobacter sp. 16-1353 TaxID=2004996 RepID=UPI0015EF91B6|nr:GNAT family N-acetyltransferase [Helicobacter sp. 16-1353]